VTNSLGKNDRDVRIFLYALPLVGGGETLDIVLSFDYEYEKGLIKL